MTEIDKINAIKMRMSGDGLHKIADKFSVSKQYINALTKNPERHLGTEKSVQKLRRLMLGMVFQYDEISRELKLIAPLIESIRGSL